MMHSDSEFTFLELCSLLQEIEDQRYRGDKITLLSAALTLPLSDNELLLMVQFTVEGAFPDLSGKRISAGARTIGLAAADFCKIDYDIVYKPSKAATGSHSETIERLMEMFRRPGAAASRPACRFRRFSRYMKNSGVPVTERRRLGFSTPRGKR